MTIPDREALLAAYDSQLRATSEVGPDATRLGPLLLGHMGSQGFVTYRDLGGVEGAELDQLIDAAIAHYRDETDVPSFEWKTRGHDAPADLDDRLRAKGFVPEEVETVMVGLIDGVIADVPVPRGVRVREVPNDDAVGFEHAFEMQSHVFGGRYGTAEQSRQRCVDSEGRRSLWVAESDEEAAAGQPWGPVVSAGLLDAVPGTDFAGVWGGSTLAHWRGRGIYRALTAARGRRAKALGVRYLQSDCTEFSRPILERAGLVKITTTTPYIWSRA